MCIGAGEALSRRIQWFNGNQTDVLPGIALSLLSDVVVQGKRAYCIVHLSKI